VIDARAFRRLFSRVDPATFAGSLDQTIVATALPAVASDLGGFNDLSWMVTA
jgi:hypothetical protein